MFLETIVVGDLDTNCYVIASEHASEAMIIDPGGDAGLILDVIAANNLDVKCIILTHAHWDHFGAAREISEKTGAKIAIHTIDKDALNNPKVSLSFLLGEQEQRITPDLELADKQIIKIGDLQAEIIHTPGHTSGSISVRIADKIFTGDLLFYRSIGRTDFPSGSFEDLIKSVKERILLYPDHVKIYPGHGPSTTVGDERKHNPFLVG